MNIHALIFFLENFMFCMNIHAVFCLDVVI